ncbi:hypothetical protein RIF29_38199 [Crotalaria pallida]|uniref:Uncharacterized protein n=1 Tax=Crotalaria pallida TaxID=3830 RepID=A0AAN9HNJ8_CROPI
MVDCDDIISSKSSGDFSDDRSDSKYPSSNSEVEDRNIETEDEVWVSSEESMQGPISPANFKPYIWYSRSSSWTLFIEVPQSILHGRQIKSSDDFDKNAIKRQFWTKVVANDDCINVKAEGSSNVAGLLKGKYEETHSINRYNCNLADLLQVVTYDYLLRWRRVKHGLVANVDPEDSEGCISWWLVMEDSFAEEQKFHMNMLL